MGHGLFLGHFGCFGRLYGASFCVCGAIWKLCHLMSAGAFALLSHSAELPETIWCQVVYFLSACFSLPTILLCATIVYYDI